jgi:tRNA uridine 5-carboxymethylaminomethyl modification enzyme
MFTSRAEYRILLRGDNADQRLTPIGKSIGLAKEDRIEISEKRRNEIEKCLELFKEIRITPEDARPIFESTNSAELKQQVPLGSIITRPEISLDQMFSIEKVKAAFSDISETALVSAEIEHKYQGYIQKEKDVAQKSKNLEDLRIPETFDYNKVGSLSNEARQKLAKIAPRTLGQAKRISGINPSDIAVLMVYIGR